MSGEPVEWTVTAGEEGERLDQALGRRPEIGSRAVAQRLLGAARVRVDGRERPKRHLLAAGPARTTRGRTTPPR